MQNDGTYMLIGMDHGQGTAQFLLCLLLGNSSICQKYNRPDFNTQNINYVTIKCKIDIYEIINLTKEETNRCISFLARSKLVALTETSNTMRGIYINVMCVSYSIRDNCFIASGPGVEKGTQYPMKYLAKLVVIEYLSIPFILSFRWAS